MIQQDQISSLAKIQQHLLAGDVSAVNLAKHYFSKIKAASFTNAYIRIFEQEALENARILDEKLSAKDKKDLGKLFGLFFSVKDVICVADQNVTAASKILEGYTSPFDATAVRRMSEQGAILLGMTNCDEFGMGSANENSVHGVVKNFEHPSYVPGGSSGGSAVAVQADTCLISLGTDTGGSVRQPASFCGVIGLKPTYGRVSRYGLIAYASSFDQIGVLGKNVQDIGSVLEVIEGKDDRDTTSADLEVMESDHVAAREDAIKEERGHGEKAVDVQKKYRLSTIAEVENSDAIQSEIKERINGFVRQLENQGLSVSSNSFSLLDFVVPTYYILTTAEASSNLSRYDGVRYGYRSERGDDLEEMYRHTRSEGFGAEVKRRIMLGTFVLSSGYYDAYFTRAQKVRRLIQQKMDEILSENDFIIMPTAPSSAWKIGSKEQDPISVYMADIFTVIANLCGLPAISLPLGHDAQGLPFGMQVIGRRFDEKRLLDFCSNIQ